MDDSTIFLFVDPHLRLWSTWGRAAPLSGDTTKTWDGVPAHAIFLEKSDFGEIMRNCTSQGDEWDDER